MPYQSFSESAVGSGTATRSWTHNQPAGQSLCLVVGTGARGDNAANLVVSSVTYNSVAMTKQREDITGDVGGPEFAGTSLWTLVAPSLGDNTVLVTYTGSISNVVAAFAESYDIINQTTPVHASSGATDVTGASSTPSVTVTTTVPHCIVLDAVYSGNDVSNSVGAGQTIRSNRAVTGISTDQQSGSEESAPSAGVVTMSWTTDVATFWASSGIALRMEVYPLAWIRA